MLKQVSAAEPLVRCRTTGKGRLLTEPTAPDEDEDAVADVDETVHGGARTAPSDLAVAEVDEDARSADAAAGAPVAPMPGTRLRHR
jgi:hypothetical protein